MSWAFAYLGITADTDAAGVKRAYAKLLRQTRPDEDPEGFQRLHEAYKLALIQVRKAPIATAQAAGAEHPNPSAATPAEDARSTAHIDEDQAATSLAESESNTSSHLQALSPKLVSVADEPRAEPMRLAHRVIRQAMDTDEDQVLSVWLASQPEFWSLRIKQQTGKLMLQQLFREPLPMSPHCLDALLQFFDLDQVLSGINPSALDQLRQRQQAMWYVLPQNHRTLALRLNIPSEKSLDPRAVQAILRQLCLPPGWRGLGFAAVSRRRTRAIVRLIHGLCGGQLDLLPSQIDRRQAEFWYRAARLAQPSSPRLIVGSMRAVFLGAILFLGVASVCVLSSALGSADINWHAALKIGLMTAGGAVSVWLIYAIWMSLSYWQCQPEFMPTEHAWLRRILIPVLCAFGLAVDYLTQAPQLALSIVIPTLFVMLRRFTHRRPPTRRKKREYLGLIAFFPAVILLAFFLFAVASKIQPRFYDHIPLVAIVAAACLCLWLADMWKHHTYLKSRKASRPGTH